MSARSSWYTSDAERILARWLGITLIVMLAIVLLAGRVSAVIASPDDRTGVATFGGDDTVAGVTRPLTFTIDGDSIIDLELPDGLDADNAITCQR